LFGLLATLNLSHSHNPLFIFLDGFLAFIIKLKDYETIIGSDPQNPHSNP
jgi:hypothetical protein